MNKQLLLAFALLLGAKAFAQDWAYTYEYDQSSDTVVESTCKEAYEMSDGRILVSGISLIRNNCGILTGDHTGYYSSIIALDSDGALLHQAKFHKKGYKGCCPYVFENEQGETFILHQFNPDHDSCSFNYFKNFDPPIDHSTLALYKLNDDLSIAETYEWDFPIDTFEYAASDHVYYGEISLFSAMVDSDGYIVGGYIKTVSTSVEPRGKDSTFFFKMDFEGNMLKLVGYETIHSGYYPESYYRYYHMVEADSLYLYYGWAGEVTNQENRNLIYLDKDFNVVRTRRYKHSIQLPGIVGGQDFVYDQSVMRSPFGSTYMTCLANETKQKSNEKRNYYACVLYEFDDSGAYPPIVPIKRFLERKTKNWDLVPVNKGVDVTGDNSLYFAYTLNVGLYWNLDSWIMIEHLTSEFETIASIYYDLPGELMHCHANGITATQDGGALLTLWGYDLNQPDRRFESVVKFPAEAFLGIEEAHASGLKVAVAYPNPGSGTLNICTGLPNARLEVYDATGRLIHGQEVTESETAIDAESWSSGIYVWKVYSNNKEAETGKWVKE